MNKTNLKSYAPKARIDFIAAVTARANLLGIHDDGILAADLRGEISIIDGREWPLKISEQRDALIQRIERIGFGRTMEEIAYTWFNRFAALRFMELHDYLDHGWRVLSSRDGGLPELLSHAGEVSLSGLSKERAIEMQLAGNQDNELYKLLIVAQCNELSRSMPFLFERIDDESELLLPENLLRTDSIVANLVASVPEEDWDQIESIGWLYQYYVSERKGQVIGGIVQSEDIPAATQLFTPNWIVKYLVQNSVGRLWQLANPATGLRAHWEYFVAPQALPLGADRQAQLVRERLDRDGGSLNPETIKVLDPACGSGHILVEAYEILKAIYLERGYRLRDIPRLILEKNLFGVDIDDRAAQLTGFALLMKARADDRRVLSEAPKLNIIALVESDGVSVAEAATTLAAYGAPSWAVGELVELFARAKTFGSLLQVPAELKAALPALAEAIGRAMSDGDLYAKAAAEDIGPLVEQASVLGATFDAVVANPPYLNRKAMTAEVKNFAVAHYPEGRADLYAMFVIRCAEFCEPLGSVGLMTPFVWMFLSSYQEIRELLTSRHTLTTLIQPEYHTFFESANVPICAFVFDNAGLDSVGSYYDLTSIYGSDVQAVELARAIASDESPLRHVVDCKDFSKLPSSPIAYWTTAALREAMHDSKPVTDFAVTKQGLKTGKNALFLRRWHEVSTDTLGIGFTSRLDAAESGKRWFLCSKGGAFRKWYGNNEYVVDWEDDGARIRSFVDADGDLLSRPQNMDYYFRAGMTWSTLTIGSFSMRWSPSGSLFESKGSMCFPNDPEMGHYLLAFFNTKLVNSFLRATAPTLDYGEGPVSRLPLRVQNTQRVKQLAIDAIDIAKADWDAYEFSNDFVRNPLFDPNDRARTLASAWDGWNVEKQSQFERLLTIERENNRHFISLFGLDAEIDPEVDEDQITLLRADREKDAERLVSYAIGCMMGRFSLDVPGLVFAKSGTVPLEVDTYSTFEPDGDGIIPVTDVLWFDDDATLRLRAFVAAAWGADALDENMAWIADGLGRKGSESPDETIRRYLTDSFFKDHLQVYKRRPIYWMFSSGRQGAFQALVYMHRYTAGTLSRMRSEYIAPLGSKIVSRMEMLEADSDRATTAAARSKISKQLESLRKKQTELHAYDEKLRQYADRHIEIDLNDGVKSNYSLFGDLVSDSKAISGAGDD